jgi:hypothetical protein
MTTWLQQCEKILLYTIFINQRQHNHLGQSPISSTPEPPYILTQTIKMARKPTTLATFDILAHNYGAVDFQDALVNYLACVNNPRVSVYMACKQAEDMLIPFCSVSVYHNMKFTTSGPSEDLEISDMAHAQPEGVDIHVQIISAYFDTVIVQQDGMLGQGNKGMCHLYWNITRLTNY